MVVVLLWLFFRDAVKLACFLRFPKLFLIQYSPYPFCLPSKKREFDARVYANLESEDLRLSKSQGLAVDLDETLALLYEWEKRDVLACVQICRKPQIQYDMFLHFPHEVCPNLLVSIALFLLSIAFLRLFLRDGPPKGPLYRFQLFHVISSTRRQRISAHTLQWATAVAIHRKDTVSKSSKSPPYCCKANISSISRLSSTYLSSSCRSTGR